jgi:hypothetical protein
MYGFTGAAVAPGDVITVPEPGTETLGAAGAVGAVRGNWIV